MVIFSHILGTFKYILKQDADFKGGGDVRYVVPEEEVVPCVQLALSIPCVAHDFFLYW